MTAEDNEIEKSPEEIKEIKPVEPLTPFTLEILKIIKDFQQQHGLRHGDYQRYRGYCSRRIRRLRKTLKMPQGDRRHFKKRDIQESQLLHPQADERFLHIYLVLAERCWAYAMQLRQESNTEPRKKFHLIQKLRKACAYALQLENLCQIDRCDARTKLEAQAYVAWIQASLEFELQLWLKATENFKKAQVIYEKLATSLPEEEQGPYKQRVEEISPSLRYCAYNIGDDKAVDLLELKSQGVLDNLDSLVLQSKGKMAEVLQEITWFGLKVSVRIEKVRLFLIGIEGLDESLKHAEDTQAKIKILENLFIDLRDIISLTRESARTEKEDNVLLTYLLSIRVERTSQRNLLLIQQSKRAQDCIRLMDIIIQQTNELSQNEMLINDEKAQKYYKEQILAYQALRTFYVAKAQVSQKKWREAAVLFHHCSQSAKKIDANKFYFQLKEIFSNVKENVDIEMVKSQANYVLDKDEGEIQIKPQKVHKSKKPLIERLDEFRDEPQLLTKNPNLVTMPPNMEPIPVKPIFYDLALNHIKFPDLSDKMTEPGKKANQAAGISGFVKGLWGWGKK